MTVDSLLQHLVVLHASELLQQALHLNSSVQKHTVQQGAVYLWSEEDLLPGE